jgi:hypothetical protein
LTTARRSRPRVRLLPYKAGSVSARTLARATGLLRLRGRTRFAPRATDLIINWGSRTYPNSEFNIHGTAPVFLNHPQAVYYARDKRETFRLLTEGSVPTLEWTVDIAEAARWFSEGHVVMQRNTATGQGGVGIVVCDPTLTVKVEPDGQGVLWTKYFKKRSEYRVHVWGNDILDLQEKRKRRGAEACPRIRSHSNGWVFAREGVAVPACVGQAAVAAVRALGLDFGAVDIGYNAHYDRAAVFEVNTAPGIEGTTLEKYASKIKELVA